MFEKGVITEVKKFNRLKIKKENSALKVIGIEEIGKYLRGEINLSGNHDSLQDATFPRVRFPLSMVPTQV